MAPFFDRHQRLVVRIRVSIWRRRIARPSMGRCPEVRPSMRGMKYCADGVLLYRELAPCSSVLLARCGTSRPICNALLDQHDSTRRAPYYTHRKIMERRLDIFLSYGLCPPILISFLSVCSICLLFNFVKIPCRGLIITGRASWRRDPKTGREPKSPQSLSCSTPSFCLAAACREFLVKPLSTGSSPSVHRAKKFRPTM